MATRENPDPHITGPRITGPRKVRKHRGRPVQCPDQSQLTEKGGSASLNVGLGA